MDEVAGFRSEFLELVERRRSCRRYDPSRSVPPDVIDGCLQAARLAPSACNGQPWRFVVVDDAETRRALYDKARMPGIRHTWWQDVPVFVALCAERDLLTPRVASAISGVQYSLLDLGIAGEHFVLAAADAGLGTCWVGWFRERVVKKLLKIPRHVRVVSLIAVGYAAEERERTSPRRDLAELAFKNEWAAPWGCAENAADPGATG